MATRTATNVAFESPVTISSLAKSISSLSEQLVKYLALQAQAEPGFRADPDAAIVPVTPEYEDLRAPLNDAALDLLRLVNGPKNSLFSILFSQYELAALQVALDRRFFDLVPLPASCSDNRDGLQDRATLAEIAVGGDMDVSRAGQVMNTLATIRIFRRVPGEVETFAHTAASALLARDRGFHALADMQLGNMLKAASETAATIRASPHESSSTHSPFQKRYGASMYQYLQAHVEDAARFSEAMSSYAQFQHQEDNLQTWFDWTSLGRGKVVDIGGGSGHISLALGRTFPELSFIVQDISPHMLASGREEDLGGRLAFQQHDFFAPQPVRDASAYLIRQCLHNYNDADCVRILQAVAPALAEAGPAVPLLISDIVMPEGGIGTTRFHENHLRRIDICMLVAMGAKQRNEREWRALLRTADTRFKIRDTRVNPLGIGLLRVYLEG